jgi:hypothetical protein
LQEGAARGVTEKGIDDKKMSSGMPLADVQPTTRWGRQRSFVPYSNKYGLDCSQGPPGKVCGVNVRGTNSTLTPTGLISGLACERLPACVVETAARFELG